MDHELALQLKVAGFPIELVMKTNVPNGKAPLGYGFFQNGDAIYRLPTLSELIASCAGDFDALHLMFNGEWIAYAHTSKAGFASCPEDAVAKLWLALRER